MIFYNLFYITEKRTYTKLGLRLCRETRVYSDRECLIVSFLVPKIII